MGFAPLPPLNLPADNIPTVCQPINLIGRFIRSCIYPLYDLIERGFSRSKHILAERTRWL